MDERRKPENRPPDRRPPRREYDGVVYDPGGSLTREPREPREPRDDRDARAYRQPRETREPREYGDTREPRGAREGSRVSGDTQRIRRAGAEKEPELTARPRPKPSQNGGRGGGKKRKPPKSQFAVFYIATLFTGVLVCIVIFAVVFNSIAKDSGPRTVAGQTNTPAPTDVAIREINQMTGVIRQLDFGKRSVGLTDVETGATRTVVAEDDTHLKDRFGQQITFAELNKGMIADVSFDDKSGKLTELALSPQAWEIKMVKNVAIDVETRTVTVGNDGYTYDSDLEVLYGGEPYNINAITPMDVVSLTGYKSKVWRMELNKSHGTIRFLNTEKIKDGTVEVDTTIFVPLPVGDDVPDIQVVEGPHRVVVKGANIEPFTREVNVSAGQTAPVDMGEAQIRSGLVNVKVNQEEYTLTVDGEAVTVTGEPLVLEYGEHTVKAEKEGFVSVEQKFNVDQPTKDISLDLKVEIKTAKLTVTTNPPGADVYIDNGKMGTTPLDLTLEQGSHTIMIKKEGYVDVSVPAELDKDYIFEVNLQNKELSLPMNPIDMGQTQPPATQSPATQPPVTPTDQPPVVNENEGDFQPNTYNNNF